MLPALVAQMMLCPIRACWLVAPVLEIDLRAFTPKAFSPEAVKQEILDAVADKEWLWPRREDCDRAAGCPEAAARADARAR